MKRFLQIMLCAVLFPKLTALAEDAQLLDTEKAAETLIGEFLNSGGFAQVRLNTFPFISRETQALTALLSI